MEEATGDEVFQGMWNSIAAAANVEENRITIQPVAEKNYWFIPNKTME